MPILTPPPDWVPGPVTSAMMNARIRDAIRELQAGAARGILYSADSTGVAAATSSTWVPVPGTAGSFSVDSPRTLQAIVQCTLNGDAAGIIGSVRANINGVASVFSNIRLEAAGGAGQVLPNYAGIAVPVSAGTVSVELLTRRTLGGSSFQVLTGATLQIIDQGAS